MLHPEAMATVALDAAHRVHEREAPEGAHPQPRRLLFRGERDDHTAWVWVSAGGGPSRVVPLYLAVHHHSPTGFAWGHSGSGAAQLALALCIEVVGRHRAEQVYQTVKNTLVVSLVENAWMLGGSLVLSAVIDAEANARRGCAPAN